MLVKELGVNINIQDCLRQSREIKSRYKKNDRLINAQQKLIGGERLDWDSDEVKNFVFYEWSMDRHTAFKDIADSSLLSKMPKPVIVETRKKGMTSHGELMQCHANVQELVKKYGGKAIRGYELYVSHFVHNDKPSVQSISLNHHSVWKTPEGKFVDVTRLSDGNLRPEKSLFIPLIVQQSGLIIHDSDDKVILTQVMDKSIVVMKDKDDGKILLVNDNFIDAYKTILITMRIDLGQRLRDGILHNFQVGQFSNFREVA